jgi:penicillin amidase
MPGIACASPSFRTFSLHKLLRWIRRTLLALLVLVTAAAAGGWWWLRGSMPLLDGSLALSGLEHPVSVERDARGLVFLAGATRADIAQALGFVHAQERFFQMDLQRRAAAGELAELFGPAALEADRGTRLHRFRVRGLAILQALPPADRRLLEHYRDGVNAGLDALARPPFEYALLGRAPRAWTAEDSLLTIFSMYLVLQDREARFERALGLMADTLPADLFRFFARQGGDWDAPLLGDPLPPAPLPRSGLAQLFPGSAPRIAYTPHHADDALPGSNNWAVSGRLTAHGGAIVANDMHLPIRVPNIWFRAGWTHPQTGRPVGGVTLPGAPVMVAGSNGKVAWGFTNTQGDWSDVVLLETDRSGAHYATAEGFEPFAELEEIILVKGAEPDRLLVRETRWGPVIGKDHRGRLLALRWTAHDPQAVNAELLYLEQADTVEAAIARAPRLGIPHQNLVIGDDRGVIGWTIAGPVPDRQGLDGVLPTRWDRPGVGWRGYLGEASHPRLVDPESGRLWSANARVLSGDAYRVMGSQGAALGARQQQIRDRLLAGEQFDEAAMLAIQLDDEARFLARWRDRMLAVIGRQPADEALREAAEHLLGWSGAADRGDVGYRLARAFRLKVIELVTAPLETYLKSMDPQFELRHMSRQIEYPVWDLLEQRPAHLLNPDFASWPALEQAAASAAVQPLYADGSLADDTWGAINRLQVRHPLAGALPPLDWWLSMPAEPMNGDSYMPRVQRPAFAASERFAVSPGREDQAYLHMATGQSAHPLSPFFAAGHEDWVQGRMSSWSPGPARYRLHLVPASSDRIDHDR